MRGQLPYTCPNLAKFRANCRRSLPLAFYVHVIILTCSDWFSPRLPVLVKEQLEYFLKPIKSQKSDDAVLFFNIFVTALKLSSLFCCYADSRSCLPTSFPGSLFWKRGCCSTSFPVLHRCVNQTREVFPNPQAYILQIYWQVNNLFLDSPIPGIF